MLAVCVLGLLFVLIAPASANESAAGSPLVPAKIARLALPQDFERTHEENAVMDFVELSMPSPGAGAFGERIKLEASYNESISLKELLENVLKYNLPIRIARESRLYQRGQLFAALAGFTPTYYQSYKATGVTVFPNTRAPSQLFISEVRYPVFLGGAVLHKSLGQYYRYKAWRRLHESSIDQALLDAYKKYSDLVLQNVLLQVRERSLSLIEANLRLLEANYKAGLCTHFDILQLRAHLATEKELYHRQELKARASAMALSVVMNAPLLINFLPSVSALKEDGIFKEKLSVAELEKLALKHRPDLRQYELFKLAAQRTVQTAAASFYPELSFFTTYTAAAVKINNPNNEELLNGVAAVDVAQSEENFGVVSNTALDQTASFSPGSSNTAVDGANTLSNVVAGSGGNPIANVQSGSIVTSGAVKPNFSSSAITGAPSTSNIQGSNTANAAIFPGHSQNFQSGMNLNWTLSNLGLSTAATVLSARALSRQAILQANQSLMLAMKQVHAAYMAMLVAQKRVDAAASAVRYARESLKLSRRRLRFGLGTSIELIESQNNYIQALSGQAEAITAVNIAQAALLKETGLISVDTLTAGYR